MGVEATRRPGPGMAPIPLEDSVQALKDHPFEGKWEAVLSFTSVEMAASSSSHVPEVASMAKSTGAFVGSAGRSKRGTLITPAAEVAKAGGKVKIALHLETKGAAYFKGTCPEMAQFGKVREMGAARCWG